MCPPTLNKKTTKRIDILIQVTGNIDRLLQAVSLLNGLEKPAGYKFQLVLMFINPWMVEEFCKTIWPKSSNIVVYLSDDNHHDISHIHRFLQKNKSKNFYVIEDRDMVEDDFYSNVVERLNMKG
jgi:hypothetical protein